MTKPPLTDDQKREVVRLLMQLCDAMKQEDDDATREKHAAFIDLHPSGQPRVADTLPPDWHGRRNWAQARMSELSEEIEDQFWDV